MRGSLISSVITSCYLGKKNVQLTHAEWWISPHLALELISGICVEFQSGRMKHIQQIVSQRNYCFVF